ncbi:aldose 1-epimerase family protein [Sphingobacterium siyangense]|uniref:aldose 1-epimerase family protein n=1 Tax=Sphingobacterium siyangense TaxID=459529 RepID=UPI00200DC711|nr:aldose 1-epimerase family protein [Sphingobacterium siyangense]UQA75616.1 aldose 1-epimerase family protein [Sphingobacterium siyangense]
MHTIENEFLRVGIKEKGAELQSAVDKGDNYEWIWQADERYWAKSSPILFPIVGALKEGRFIYGGQSYSLPRHGFARDNSFELVEKTETSIVFSFQANEATRYCFPFEFSLRIKYELKGNRLEVSYAVFNQGTEEIYFSLGAHPAFNCSYDQVDTRCYIEFPADDRVERYFLHDNLLSKTYNKIKLENHCLFFNKETFKEDAWILKNLNSTSVRLKSDNKQLIFSFEGFPYFGLWSVPGSSFICLEPWQGLPDHINHNLLFSEKEGIVKLDGTKSWEAKWSIAI